MVFFISGLSGSGKTTAAEFFKKNGIPIVRMGDVTGKSMTMSSLPLGEDQEARVREALRMRYGPSVYAVRTLPRIQRALQASSKIVVEGIRSDDEWRYFQKNIGNFCLIYVETDENIRHRRLQKREIRPLTDSEVQRRDVWEKEEMHLEILKDRARYMVENNGTKEALFMKLEEILQKYPLEN